MDSQKRSKYGGKGQFHPTISLRRKKQSCVPKSALLRENIRSQSGNENRIEFHRSDTYLIAT